MSDLKLSCRKYSIIAGNQKLMVIDIIVVLCCAISFFLKKHKNNEVI